MQCEDWDTAVDYVPALKAAISGDESHKVNLWEATCGGPVYRVSYEIGA